MTLNETAETFVMLADAVAPLAQQSFPIASSARAVFGSDSRSRSAAATSIRRLHQEPDATCGLCLVGAFARLSVKDIRAIVKYLGVFGAGAAAAALFLGGLVDRHPQPAPAAANGAWVLVPPTTPIDLAEWKLEQPTEPPQQPTRPAGDPPNAETTGSSAPQSATDIPHDGPQMTPNRAAACNVSVCRSFYRSFDEATCTYRPYGGGPPQLCNR